MTGATENRIDMAATVVSPAAEAAELETRVFGLRRELVGLDERREASSDAPRRRPAPAPPSHPGHRGDPLGKVPRRALIGR